MSKKRFQSLVSVFLLILILAACGWSGEEGGFGGSGKAGDSSSEAQNTAEHGGQSASEQESKTETAADTEKTGDAEKEPAADKDGIVHIKTPEQLAEFADRVNNGEEKDLSAVLDADIDMSSVCGASVGSWTPIRGLKGDFDGNGHTISSLYCVRSESAAMFIEPKGNIKNLEIKDAVIESTENSAAGLAISLSGTIENCRVSGSVKGYKRAGGIVTDTYRDSAVFGCVNEASVEGGYQDGNDYDGCAAGIAAWPREGGEIRECVNKGSIIGGGAYTGGILGKCEKGNILAEDCINEGNVQGPLWVSGIAGYAGSNTLINRCVNKGKVSGGMCVCGIAGKSGFVIINCANYGDLEASGSGMIDDVFRNAEAVGIAKHASEGIVNCYNRGNIVCENDAMAFGYSNSGMVLNLYNYSTITCTGTTGHLSDGLLWEGREGGLLNTWSREGCIVVPADFGADQRIATYCATTEGAFTDGTILEELNRAVESINSKRLEDFEQGVSVRVEKFLGQGDFELSKWVAGDDGLPRFEWE